MSSCDVVTFPLVSGVRYDSECYLAHLNVVNCYIDYGYIYFVYAILPGVLYRIPFLKTCGYFGQCLKMCM